MSESGLLDAAAELQLCGADDDDANDSVRFAKQIIKLNDDSDVDSRTPTTKRRRRRK